MANEVVERELFKGGELFDNDQKNRLQVRVLAYDWEANGQTGTAIKCNILSAKLDSDGDASKKSVARFPAEQIPLLQVALQEAFEKVQGELNLPKKKGE